VIGRGGRGIRKADALAHVFGYTIVNDVTARTLQHKHRQWILSRFARSGQRMRPVIPCADLGGGADHGWQVARFRERRAEACLG
jgi:2-keto-4-pentenoate hydratase/2-oxohepta-3-ene-1,7-dioic acid hydratase in catechol pathway